LVLNLNGREYLDACLSSLEAQAYPRDCFEIVLVDNGSTDGSVAFVRDRYSRARVFALGANGGFCAPYNAAIKTCDSEFVALLNNDTRVDPHWLTELVSAADRHNAVAVASKILDWTGETIDFVGGVTSFIGHSWQRDFREPATRAYDDRPLLFPCAGSALFARRAFLDAGAFDEEFFAYFEDVDLGWRLNLFGEIVVLAPKAVTYHRMHGTSSRWAFAQRLRLLERNALATIYKNYETATLERVLPAAVGLCLLRASMRSGIDTLTLALSDRPSSDTVEVHPYLIAHLIGLEDFCRQLPALRRKREIVQQRRRRSDAELFELFGDPLRLHETGGLYEEVASVLIREFGIDEIFGAPRSSSTRTVTADTPEDAWALDATTRPVSPGPPRVSIVILTALGPTHLRECLTSLRQQTYPADRVEVIVVDNGSTEDPTPEVRAGFPGARVIRNETNVGFAAGNNQGAAAATGEFVIFLNDDTRAHPDWLTELVATARRRGAACVASYILDWSGATIDFADGAVNFQGKGFQLDYGVAVDRRTPEEKPLLFACGCAMLIDRTVLAEVGGWDEGAFAYYEDVELGWRLHVLGHDVWLAPRAIVYHKHHGTSGRWPEPPRLRLYERNALRLLYGLLETKTLARALPAALLLAADRALLATGPSRAADAPVTRRHRRLIGGAKATLRDRGITRSTPIGQAISRLGRRGFLTLARDVARLSSPGGLRSRREAYLIERGGMPSTFDAQPESIPLAAAAMLAGIYGFLSDLPKLARRRAALQARRRATDREIIGRFGSHWLASSGSPSQAEHYALHSILVDEFGLEALARHSMIAAATRSPAPPAASISQGHHPSGGFHSADPKNQRGP
jgi:GT2 family glycosyltransferase